MKTTQELKEIYEANPNGWIVIINDQLSIGKHYRILQYTNFTNTLATYKLIHIKHKQVLEAYLKEQS